MSKEEEKKLSDTEDLLEDLGRATDKVKGWQNISDERCSELTICILFCNHIQDRKREAKVGFYINFHCAECPYRTHCIVFILGTEGLSQGG